MTASELLRKYINIVDEACQIEDATLDEVAPKGWEGTVKAMKKHKEIENPWALANYMKKQGYKSHRGKSKK